MSVFDLFSRFLPYVRATGPRAIICALLVLLIPIISAALLWAFKLLVDDVLIARNFDAFATFAALYLGIALSKVATGYVAQKLEVETVEQIVLSLRADLYAHVLSLSPGSLDNERGGDVLARLQGDTDRTEFVIFTGPLSILADGAAAIVFITFLTILDWRLAALTIAALPVIMLMVARLSPQVRRASKLSRRAESLWMSLAEERLAARPLVHAYDALNSEGAAFRHRCGHVKRMEVLSQVLQARQSALVELTIVVAGLAVLGVGAHLVASGAATPGTLIAFIGAVGSLYQPVRSLAKAAGRFHSAAAGAQRVAALLDRQSLVQDRPDAVVPAKIRGTIEFRGVSFAYPHGGEVIQDVSIRIPAGETVAIVGPSGSGKTSLLRLLLRQYDPAGGSVSIDGVNVRDMPLSVLRRAIAPVFQDALVLSGSIAANIRYGDRSSGSAASSARIDAASHAAAVDPFASGRTGLLATAGAWGSRLSGGQRQRVALARALYKDAPILVLDEATAGVDSETEDHIQAALRALHGKRTILIVAHRLSSLRTADRVLVIEDGRLVEDGRPAELLSRPSRCRDIFAAQLVLREAAE